jgi:hypothetical protein
MTDAQLLEYDKLKEEQGRRIHFRDNMRYVTLAAIGVAATQADARNPALWLVIPWICVVLGWNYVANVHIVRGLGDYIRDDLGSKVSKDSCPGTVFGWEHRRCGDKKYASRRLSQFVVDEITFFVPGVIALAIFGLTQGGSRLLWLVVSGEAILCCWIGYQIYEAAEDAAKAWLRKRPRSLVDQARTGMPRLGREQVTA